MKSKHYFILLIIVPLLLIGINIFLISNINKKLTYKKVSIQYEDRNILRKNVGIYKYTTRGGVNIRFTSTENEKYERVYIGIIQGGLAHYYYNKLIKSNHSLIGFYALEKKTSSNQSIPFYSLGNQKGKNTLYYLDIYSYVKKKYSVLFVITYLLLFLILLSIGINYGTIESSKFIVITDLIILALYIFV